jgi:hypothetical protein
MKGHSIEILQALINEANELFARSSTNSETRDLNIRLYLKEDGGIGIKVIFNYFLSLHTDGREEKRPFMAAGNTCQTFQALNDAIYHARGFFTRRRAYAGANPLDRLLSAVDQHFTRLFGNDFDNTAGTLNHHRRGAEDVG